MKISTVRRELEEYEPAIRYEHPFQKYCSRNALESYHAGSHLPDTKILLLECRDLHNALKIASSQCTSNRSIHIHINDPSKCRINAARSVLMCKVFSAVSFDPSACSRDFNYLWSVWYDTLWSKETAYRFKNDILGLLEAPLPSQVTVQSMKALKELRNIWKSWLKCLEESISNPNIASRILAERLNVIQHFHPFNSEGAKLSETFLLISLKDYPQSLRRLLAREESNYFITGNTWSFNQHDGEAYINPTLIKSDVSNQWIIHPEASPFNGYLPLPIDELEETSDENGFLTKYCKKKLSLLLTDYGRCRGKVSFVFHISNPLELCYSLPIKFDAIDCSSLAEKVGLANLIVAVGKRLSDEPESILLIEITRQWRKYELDASRYVEEALCVPLSIMPSMLGLRLAYPIDRIGSALQPDSPSTSICLIFKRTPAFKNIKLQVQPSWAIYFEKLSRKCFALQDGEEDSCTKAYTPLTFFYFLQAAAEYAGRGNEPLLRLGLTTCHPFFRLSARTILQWMWITKSFHLASSLKVNTGNIEEYMSYFPSVHLFSCRIPFNNVQLLDFMDRKIKRSPLARLILVPTALFNMLDLKKTITWHLIPEAHCLDNVRLDFQKSLDLQFGWIKVSFPLISDNGIIESHTGILVDFPTGIILASIGPLEHLQREPFNQVNPFSNGGTNLPEELVGINEADSSLLAQSCIESEHAFSILVRLKYRVNKEGLKWFTEVQHPCRSAHQLTIIQEHPSDMQSLALGLPHPFLSDHIGVNYISDTEAELTLLKAFNDPWPAEFNHQPDWSADYLPHWPLETPRKLKNDLNSLFIHMERQYDAVNKRLLNPNSYAALNQVRQVIAGIFNLVISERHSFLTIRCLDSENVSEKVALECEPDWLIQVDCSIRRSPQGVPILLISAFDHERALELIRSEKVTATEVENEAVRVFFSKIPDETVVNSFILGSREASCLFRYILRQNALKIEPSKNQVEQSSSTENSAWFTTFLSPRYSFRAPSAAEALTTLQKRSSYKCSYCKRFSEELTPCPNCCFSRYCGVDCRQADLDDHAIVCDFLRNRFNRSEPRY